MYRRILIAIDGSELSLRGLEHGLSLAAHLDAKVDLVTVSEPWAGGIADAQGWSVGYESGPEYRAEREQAANAILQPALDRAAEMEVEAEPVHVLDQFAADGILQTIEARHNDLVVMTSHGRRGLTRVLLGSQSAEVVTRSPVPVLVVR
ncbi:Nucleotide-binding universal stress protein, UspA family [Pseudoxanthomonas sp. GM95]|uniref:universal stress protein n=1 Tax=Pseudoxanthomonas sp. GM95 TaxID=1881043 RepID=UPI0008C4516D|nr:universal stress protein [Pseudoxanthomonas sp. GM95]SEM17101.1 Nucleotide-binding universal stress protein, UspA family [Pseudoxanthomonas sp. GM95]